MDEELSKKILNTIEKVSTLRGIAITKFVDVDKIMGAIITNYFAKSDKHSSFDEMIVSDPYFSFGLKMKILLRIAKKIEFISYKGFKDDLYKLDKLRNRLAHAGLFGFDGHLIYHGDKELQEIRNIEEIYNDFMKLWVKIIPELDSLFWKVIGKPKPF